MPPELRELDSRSGGPGDMKSLMVEEMSILWSAMGGSGIISRQVLIATELA